MKNKSLLLLAAILFCGQALGGNQTWTKSKIFILHEPSGQARYAARIASKMMRIKSHVPNIFIAELETRSCRSLDKSLSNVDWYLVLCVDKKRKLNVLRFRREPFYSLFSPYWSKN
ncbi:MAG: hypothetical protein QE271_07810 [Bacteriovoracaceae bacterium]|nr:hypothetical protein [Bacteriovoracaceae bacterium]